MIKNILYVEDGSVDVNALENSLGNETKVIVYRKGRTMPTLIQPVEPIKTEVDDYWIKFTVTEFCKCLAHLIVKDERYDVIGAIINTAQRYGIDFDNIYRNTVNEKERSE